jgi:hypothetical protein
MDQRVFDWLASRQPWRTRFGWVAVFEMAKRLGDDDRAARIKADLWARTSKVTMYEHGWRDRVARLEAWRRSKEEARKQL